MRGEEERGYDRRGEDMTISEIIIEERARGETSGKEGRDYTRI